MTFDILLVALAALVLSNVVLLVAATRSWSFGRDGEADAPEGRPNPVRRRAADPVAGSPSPLVPASGHPGPSPERLEDVPAAPDSATDPGTHPGSAPDTYPGTDPRPAAAPDPADAVAQPVAAGAPDPSVGATAPPARTGRVGPVAKPAARAKSGRGRRFTLPSIEVDHARTERVVLSLLSGDDQAPAGEMVDAWERMVGGAADGAARHSAVVVALTLEGLEELTEAAGRDSAERLVGAVLDAIRRSARATDRVASIGRGHFRVLLVDADEAVAARFIARVREAVDRRLTLASPSVGLAAGWSEAAGADRLEVAVRTAEESRRAGGAHGQRRTGRGSPA